MPGPPSSGRAGSRRAAECARSAILRAGREQKGRRMCQVRHPPGVQGTEKLHNVPGPPLFVRARNITAEECAGTTKWLSIKTAGRNFLESPAAERGGEKMQEGMMPECARAAILRAGRAQKGCRTCQDYHTSGGQGAEKPQNVPGPPSFGREQKSCRPCQGRHSSGGQGTERPQNVSGPPFFGRAGSRRAAECAGANILWVGREQRDRRMCRDRHSLGGQGADVWREGGM